MPKVITRDDEFKIGDYMAGSAPACAPSMTMKSRFTARSTASKRLTFLWMSLPNW